MVDAVLHHPVRSSQCRDERPHLHLRAGSFRHYRPASSSPVLGQTHSRIMVDAAAPSPGRSSQCRDERPHLHLRAGSFRHYRPASSSPRPRADSFPHHGGRRCSHHPVRSSQCRDERPTYISGRLIPPLSSGKLIAPSSGRLIPHHGGRRLLHHPVRSSQCRMNAPTLHLRAGSFRHRVPVLDDPGIYDFRSRSAPLA